MAAVNEVAAARFCNWLHNGQPTGPEDLGTTEDGFYFLDGKIDAAAYDVVREPDATWVIPSEDEWYKAAYHRNDGVTGHYWKYPMQSDWGLPEPSNVIATSDPGNSACFRAWPSLTLTVGAPYYRTVPDTFENSGSAYGTFDPGGNV